MENKIAVVIENYIQYVNIKEGINFLIKKGYQVDIFCPESEEENGAKKIFDDLTKILENKGYKVFRNNNRKTKYKILLEP